MSELMHAEPPAINTVERVTDLATIPDADLQALGEAFVREAQYPGSFKVGVFKRNWDMLLSRNMGAMWIVRKGAAIAGALGAVVHPDINDGDLVAQEAYWFIAPEYRGGMTGIRLLNEFEAWAAANGVKRILFAHLLASMPEKLKGLYERRGYTAVETWYIKSLTIKEKT
jgi:GNAT superfamily N-acetyltransferase